jgi:hypothetical protein
VVRKLGQEMGLANEEVAGKEDPPYRYIFNRHLHTIKMHNAQHQSNHNRNLNTSYHIILFISLHIYKNIPTAQLIYALYRAGRALFSNLGKLGVPSPVTGSHPAVAFHAAYGITGLPFSGPLNLA